MTLKTRVKTITEYSSIGQWYEGQTGRIAAAMEQVMNEHLEDSKLVGAIANDCGYSNDEADLVAARNVIETLANAYGMTVQVDLRKSLRTRTKDGPYGS